MYYLISSSFTPNSGLAHVFAISVFEDYLYWTDWEYKSIQRAHKFSGDQKKNITFTIHRPMDIQVGTLPSLIRDIYTYIGGLNVLKLSNFTKLVKKKQANYSWMLIEYVL